MRSHTLSALLGLLWLTVSGFPARAEASDEVHGTRSEKLVEQRHAVSIAMGHGHATLVVRRTVRNGGPLHDQAMFWLRTPESAVPVGLKTLGTMGGKPFWFSAELLEAEAAAARYRALTGIGGYYPKDPALLSWRHAGHFALQVFPVAPGTDKTVEYTLEMPTEYRGGRDHLVLPRMGTEAMAALATVANGDGREAIFAGDHRLAAGATLELDAANGVDLSLTRAGARRLGGALSVVPVGPGRVLLRQRIEAAPRLGEVPAGARVVVLLDASRSRSERDVEGEVAAARAYLSHFPDAQAEILTFDRRVSALHGGFVPVAKALATLATLKIARRNGSQVDEALARAGALFQGLPRRVPRRVVVFTDALTRGDLDPAAIKALTAKTGALVHVSVLRDGGPALERDDAHPWAVAVRPTGGLIWQSGGTDAASLRDRMRVVYEELARPLRIDHLTVTLPGLTSERFDYPAHLAEGSGFADQRLVERQVGWLRAEGQIWTQPVSATLVPDEAGDRLAAALVFGTDVRDQLSEPEMMTLAKLGHAVSPVTSLLAIEPGVRPSTEGLGEDEIGEVFGVGGLGLSGFGEVARGRASAPPDFAALLGKLLAPGWAACGGAGKRARLRVETTRDEVVDVSHVSAPGDPSLGRCLAEAAWNVDLPQDFAKYDHRWVMVTL
jgi:hypothetical protein